VIAEGTRDLVAHDVAQHATEHRSHHAEHELTLLAAADALMSLAGLRRQQVWEAAGRRSAPQL